MKKIAFIDMEGVLIPEIWKNFSNILNINELSLTTRDVTDYKMLMNYRIDILKKNNISLVQLVELIQKMDYMNEAKEFLEFLQKDNKFEIKIISDCFQEFLNPFIKKLQLCPEDVYCHNLEVGKSGIIENVIYTRNKGKHEVIVKYQREKRSMKDSIAIGDAFNDFTMLHMVDHGFLFQPSIKVIENAPSYFHKVYSYQSIIDYLNHKKII